VGQVSWTLAPHSVCHCDRPAKGSLCANVGNDMSGAAWWTMASHLAAQDYLARLQASAAASGIPIPGLSGTEGLVPGYPLLSAPHSQPHGMFM
jgi:hypothetical protein